jgi:LAGLIDADG endonuclease
VNKNTRNESSFRVNSLQDLTTFIIPHFEKYPLLTQKSADFILFTKIVKFMNNKVHLTEDGLQQIINIRASMNIGLSDLQKFEFSNYNLVARPIISSTEIQNPN